MAELEFEFRVYRTPREGGKRECVVARNVPHALQAWRASVDAYSRNLELVISGGWLMQLLEYAQMDDEAGGEIDECERARIATLCIEGMLAEDGERKQQCIENVLVALGYDPSAIKDEHEKAVASS
jgi:hypothetical protein